MKILNFRTSLTQKKTLPFLLKNLEPFPMQKKILSFLSAKENITAVGFIRTRRLNESLTSFKANNALSKQSMVFKVNNSDIFKRLSC